MSNSQQPEKMTISILYEDGKSNQLQLESTETVEQLKKKAYDFYSSNPPPFNLSEYKVISLKENKLLIDHHTICDEKLSPNDLLFFVTKRTVHEPSKGAEKDIKSPTPDEINEATKDLPSYTNPSGNPESAIKDNKPPRAESIFETSYDFQMEMKKIVTSLVKTMSALLQNNQDAMSVCQELHSRMKHRLERASKLNPTEGFDFTYPDLPEFECTPIGIMKGFKELRIREFHPNMKHVEILREMGFTDYQIIKALRIAKNNKDAACELLVSGKDLDSDEDDEGLDPSSNLFQALVTNPVIRLGLNNSKILFAFLSILENPSSASIWLSDNETSIVLSTIFKIYHAEKNAMSN